MIENITIGDLAEKTGVPPKTIRFYEGKGLMPRPRRSDSGYRLYSGLDIRRLQLIRAARSLGLSVRDVRDLMATAQHERCGSFQGRAARLIVDKLGQVEAKIQEMTVLKQQLEKTIQGLEHPAAGCGGGVLECQDCRCLGDQ
jgi:DNA-binding transcriptional MerR regulator